jgi:hypothetical protein
MSMTLPQPCFDVNNIDHYHVHGFGYGYKSSDYKVLKIVYTDYNSRVFPYRAELFILHAGVWETEPTTFTLLNLTKISGRFSCMLLAIGLSIKKDFVGYFDSREMVILLFHV